MPSRFKTLQFLAACGLVAASASASAADQVTFNVRLIITQACTITAASATDVDFGSALASSTTELLAQGTVTANCSVTTPYSIQLNSGSNPGSPGDVTTRRMRHVNPAVTTNNFVAYQLYQDAGRTAVWGATPNTNTVAGTGSGQNQVFQVYGRVASPASNNATPGNYQDTVTATIVY